jgi:hypothetical protein
LVLTGIEGGLRVPLVKEEIQRKNEKKAHYREKDISTLIDRDS